MHSRIFALHLPQILPKVSHHVVTAARRVRVICGPAAAVCAVAYLIGWCIMKALVPKYKPIVLE
jgi:hypothetical protein